ncbi:uroporphyrinogen decarboxylase family protein [Methanococcoides seepicolus]|uniref:Uroporphyrinogen-III decarboxylase n=1 Tax=Methanococcoides seepicolus TaxID=2828780 RepID=A0A9E4ZGY7_9EURY|nr:uroporphyrinogen decarboxylase family protein [Methanococcoides seepicolus]MCM1987891.1 uroporphyrinogen-III decarboxylase [Methanococcoides seepicolus]
MPSEDYAPMDKDWLENAGNLWTTPFVDTPSERVIVDPIILSHAASVFKKSVGYFWQNPAEAMRMVCHTCEMYDVTPVGHYLYADYWGEDYGAKVKVQANSPPGITKRPIKDAEGVDNLEVLSPEDLAKGPTLTKHFEALDTCKNEFPQMFAPITQLAGSMEVATNWASIDDVFMWMMTEPELVDKLTSKATDHMVNACKATANRYGANVMITGSVIASGDLMDRDQIKRFGYNPVSKAVRKMMNAGAGPGVYYHLCGNHSDDFDLWKDAPMSPFTVVQIGYDGKDIFPASKLVEHFGNRCTCFGTVDTKLIDRGTPRQVYDQAKEQILAGKDSPRGFIIGTSCECPTNAPPGNVHALVKAAKDFGKYEKF